MYFISPSVFSILYLQGILCLLPPAEGQRMQISMTAISSMFTPAQVTDVHHGAPSLSNKYVNK